MRYGQSRGETIAVTAARFSISESHVRKIRKGINWRPDKMDTKQLTADEVRVIRAARGVRSIPELAKQFGISKSAVYRVQHGRTYKYVT